MLKVFSFIAMQSFLNRAIPIRFSDLIENICLKIVLNPISMIVITAYFDRNVRKKGCK